MIPPVQVGRYEFQLMDIRAIQQRRHWYTRLVQRIWPSYQPGYDVALTGGISLYLTAQEKSELDEKTALHNEIMSVFGFAKTLGFRG